ncbi:N-acetylglucosamine kinase-like BadF-type ATPase [Georgenia soli]|uniref:N-acetylglucosamine kinase-like BadF-type ATPase n=1 Tax=Georgenia soli TaxID=638953 RepID=A0A2A9EI67_9MICO|nr:BadF/BadG/BcrA/BcrD ATPase family protein [Georgenia soli]PFG38578.1 N-acetylglucosamine kinase-like BadF-type ATPase [Georgenia soli]
MASPLRAVVGLDVGGTSSTAGVLADDGTVLAVLDGPGANFRSSPGAVAEHVGSLLTAVAARVRDRVGTVRPWAVDALVAGVAGAGPAGRDRAVALFQGAVPRTGLPVTGAAEVVTDPVVAYAAGAPGPDGALLLAGTGAVALRVAGFAELARSDGLGWLLGDVGSGVWLALAGLRAAAADLDGRGPGTALTRAAAAFAAAGGADGTGDPRQDLVRLTDLRSPAELGAFAREVTAFAEAGDAVASGIVAEGVAGLLRTLSVVADGATDVVLAGSVLTRPGPVREGVLAALGGPAGGPRVHDAAAPVVGSLRLAADRAGWPLPDVGALSAAVEACRA